MKKNFCRFILVFLVSSSVFAQNQKLCVNAADFLGNLNYGSTGFLYGLGDPGIPSRQMLLALRPDVAAQKPKDGLQHPNGDAFKIAPDFIGSGGKKIQIYSQDVYKQWPYEKLGIKDYLSKVEKLVKDSLADPYHDYYEWVPFNEPDVIWYNDSYMLKDFCKDWEACYKLIKSVDPNAKIAGPNTTIYRKKFMSVFMNYAKEHNCLPDTVTWHELQDDFFTDWNNHYSDFRNLEKSLGVKETPIVINEYARFSGDLAMPGKLVQFISRFEESQVHGCLAYWTTAGSLNDLVSANTCPTGAWFLYKWYGELSGKRVSVAGQNENSEGLRALAVNDEISNEIRVIFGGSQKDFSLEVKNFSAAGISGNAHLTLYKIGSSGIKPSIGEEILFDKNVSLAEDSFLLPVENCDSNNAYLAVFSKEKFSLGENEIFAEKLTSKNSEVSRRVVFNALGDGYYKIALSEENGKSGKINFYLNGENLCSLKTDGKTSESANVFLQKGINVFDFSGNKNVNAKLSVLALDYDFEKIQAEDFVSDSDSGLRTRKERNCASQKVVAFKNAGKENVLELSVNAKNSGAHKIVIVYSNGQLGDGASNYNTNVVDKEVFIKVNNAAEKIHFFRNTLGWSNYQTYCFTAPLVQGKNSISIWGEKNPAPQIDEIYIATVILKDELPGTSAKIVLEADSSSGAKIPNQAELSVRSRVQNANKNDVTFEWKKTLGPGNAQITSNGENALVSVDNPGDYIFTCTAKYNDISESADINVKFAAEGTYEAEDEQNTFSGSCGAKALAGASGGKAVGFVGNGSENFLVFNNVNVKKDGVYILTISYISGEDRTALLTANGKTRVNVAFPSGGNWTNVKTVSTKIKLKKGQNQIKISNDSYYAPDIDCIVVEEK